jgi:hypothetical protein
MFEGYVALYESPLSKVVLLENEEAKVGNHLGKDSNSGRFWFSASQTETLFIPSRGETIDAGSTGVIFNPRGLAYAVRLLITMNSDPNELKVVDLTWNKVYPNLKGSYGAVLSQTGPNSKLTFLAQNKVVNLLGVLVKDNYYLVWSDRLNIEEELSQRLGDDLFYYRYPSLMNGTLVLQTRYLCSRVKRWSEKGDSSLKIFSALGKHLLKSTRSEDHGKV